MLYSTTHLTQLALVTQNQVHLVGITGMAELDLPFQLHNMKIKLHIQQVFYV